MMMGAEHYLQADLLLTRHEYRAGNGEGVWAKADEMTKGLQRECHRHGLLRDPGQ